jgi:hypothetical protein
MGAISWALFHGRYFMGAISWALFHGRYAGALCRGSKIFIIYGFVFLTMNRFG